MLTNFVLEPVLDIRWASIVAWWIERITSSLLSSSASFEIYPIVAGILRCVLLFSPISFVICSSNTAGRMKRNVLCSIFNFGFHCWPLKYKHICTIRAQQYNSISYYVLKCGFRPLGMSGEFKTRHYNRAIATHRNDPMPQPQCKPASCCNYRWQSFR